MVVPLLASVNVIVGIVGIAGIVVVHVIYAIHAHGIVVRNDDDLPVPGKPVVPQDDFEAVNGLAQVGVFVLEGVEIFLLL